MVSENPLLTDWNTPYKIAPFDEILDVHFYEALERAKERSELDRWIISELNSLVKDVGDAYENYEPTKSARLISKFVQDNLSNWYVRLSRRRFWKGEYNKDKIAAFQTLNECLEKVSILSSPISPFFMDNLYHKCL